MSILHESTLLGRFTRDRHFLHEVQVRETLLQIGIAS